MPEELCATNLSNKKKKTKYIKRTCESIETWLADYKWLVKSHQDLFARSYPCATRTWIIFYLKVNLSLVVVFSFNKNNLSANIRYISIAKTKRFGFKRTVTIVNNRLMKRIVLPLWKAIASNGTAQPPPIYKCSGTIFAGGYFFFYFEIVRNRQTSVGRRPTIINTVIFRFFSKCRVTLQTARH